jgi:hypothetical protein
VGIADECNTSYVPPVLIEHASMLVIYEIAPSVTSGATFGSSVTNENAFTYSCMNCAGMPCDCTGVTPTTTGMFNAIGAPLKGGLVTVKKAVAQLAVGANNPSSVEVGYGNLDVPAIQFTLASGSDEANTLQSITLTDAAAAAHSTLVTAVKLWLDADASGTVTAGDTQLNNTQTFTADTATLALTPNAAQQIAAGTTNTYLVSYDFATAPTTTSWFKRLFGSAEGYAKALIAGPFSLIGCGGSSETTDTSGNIGTETTTVTFTPNIAAASDVTLTGVQSTLSITASGDAVTGGQLTIVIP